MKELEDELYGSIKDGKGDAYERDIREKTDMKLVISNFMESKE